MLGPGGADGTHQAGPVGVVRHHKTLIHATPAAVAPHLHPAARKSHHGIGSEALHPRAAQRRRRCHHQRPRQVGLGHFGGAQRGRQCHPGSAVHRVQGLHRAMHDQRPDGRIHPVQHPLRLAKGIAQQHRRPPLRRVALPPVVDLREQHRLRGPAVHRQAKRAFADESVAAHRLEGRASAIGLGLVIARHHPDPTTMRQAHLGRAQHMPRRVQ